MKGEALISAAAKALGQLPWKVVYLGGSTTHFHLTDPAAPEPELTDDVDVVVEITSPVEFQVDLREKLKEIGAKEDTSEDAPTCRWIIRGLKVDIMTPNDAVLGFANRWYSLALETARTHILADGTQIDLIHAPVFVATKLEAYSDRGKGDCLGSKDIEDIIAVVDGRPELEEELAEMPEDMQQFVRAGLSQLLADANFTYAVEGYLHEAPERAADVFARLRSITRTANSP